MPCRVASLLEHPSPPQDAGRQISSGKRNRAKEQGEARRRHARHCLMPCTRCLHEAFKAQQWIPGVPSHLLKMEHLSISIDRLSGRVNSPPQAWARSFFSP